MTTGVDAVSVYGPRGRIAKKVGEEIMYYHTDHLGSTRLLTDQAGRIMRSSTQNNPQKKEGRSRHEKKIKTSILFYIMFSP
jgi:hypothetical protein